MKQAILGATGNIGKLLTDELLKNNTEVKLLARNTPTSTLVSDVEYAPTNAENLDVLIDNTKNISVLYCTLAVPYTTKDWKTSWPTIMHNLINAARTNGFKLVFLDNVYMYGRVNGPMTETTPHRPISEKGKVRSAIATTLSDAMNRGEINAVIGRSADFYGPDTRISDRFFQGAYHDGVATWIGSPSVPRTWSYTPDNAKALALLGNNKQADGQIWHMPAAPAMAGTSFIALAEKVLGKKLQTVIVPGSSPEEREAFRKNAPEIAEMMYQYDFPYLFDSSKFQQTFGMQPTSYEKGFRHVFSTIETQQSS